VALEQNSDFEDYVDTRSEQYNALLLQLKEIMPTHTDVWGKYVDVFQMGHNPYYLGTDSEFFQGSSHDLLKCLVIIKLLILQKMGLDVDNRYMIITKNIDHDVMTCARLTETELIIQDHFCDQLDPVNHTWFRQRQSIYQIDLNPLGNKELTRENAICLMTQLGLLK
jgi:hypothetical protein